MSLLINTTGFVSADAGSVASANAVLLRGLLELGHRVRFFTKPSFVDPRPAVADSPAADRLTIVDCTNVVADSLRSTLAPRGGGLWGRVWGSLDSVTYNRGLVRAMQQHRDADLDLWLGDWARGRGDRPVVSFVQGPPGTDARSVLQHQEQIKELSGKNRLIQLKLFSTHRLNWGLPRFGCNDQVICGSQWSRQTLIDTYGLAPDAVHACPYPIDLDAFQPAAPRPNDGPLRVFWLGRFIPRKRLDVFLNGLALAIDHGLAVEGWVVGQSGFAPGYERLLTEFPHPQRLRTWDRVPRHEVPGMLAEVDVMAQPSDEENFGSSVAEALACGVPTIVGATNGTGDYLCERSIRLADDRPETFAAALKQMAAAKQQGELQDRSISRSAAERFFSPNVITHQLEKILTLAVDSQRRPPS